MKAKHKYMGWKWRQAIRAIILTSGLLGTSYLLALAKQLNDNSAWALLMLPMATIPFFAGLMLTLALEKMKILKHGVPAWEIPELARAAAIEERKERQDHERS